MKNLLFTVVLFSSICSFGQKLTITDDKVSIGDFELTVDVHRDSVLNHFGQPSRIDSVVNRDIEIMPYDKLGITFYFKRYVGFLTQILIAFEPQTKNHLPKKVFKNEITIDGIIVNSSTTAKQLQTSFKNLSLHPYGFHKLYFGDWNLAFGYEKDMNSKPGIIIIDLHEQYDPEAHTEK